MDCCSSDWKGSICHGATEYVASDFVSFTALKWLSAMAIAIKLALCNHINYI